MGHLIFTSVRAARRSSLGATGTVRGGGGGGGAGTFCEKRPLEAIETWGNILLRSESLIPRPFATSEAIRGH